MSRSSFVRNSASAISAILLLFLAILPFALTTVAFQKLHDYDRAFRSQLKMEIYLKPEVSNETLGELFESIRHTTGYLSHNFHGKAEIYRNFQTSQGIESNPLEVANPFPDIITVTFTPSASTLAGFRQAQKQLQTNPAIESINYGEKLLEKNEGAIGTADRILKALRVLSIILGVAFFYAIMRRAILAHQRHFDMLKMLGSGWRTTAMPFVVKNTTWGIMASIAAMFVLYEAASLLNSMSVDIQAISSNSLFLILGFGAAAGMLCSTAAVSREL